MPGRWTWPAWRRCSACTRTACSPRGPGRSRAPSVVDVDAPHGIPTMRQLIADGLLPRTVVQRTGSDGYHLVYKHPGAGMRIMSGAGKGGLGVDIKADDAYVVVAPSVHPRTRQRYQWIGSFSGEPTSLPEYWVERLREPERPARTSRLPLQSVTGSRYALAPCAASWRSSWTHPRERGTTRSTRARSPSVSSWAPGCSTRKARRPCWKTSASASAWHLARSAGASPPGCVPGRGTPGQASHDRQAGRDERPAAGEGQAPP